MQADDSLVRASLDFSLCSKNLCEENVKLSLYLQMVMLKNDAVAKSSFATAPIKGLEKGEGFLGRGKEPIQQKVFSSSQSPLINFYRNLTVTLLSASAMARFCQALSPSGSPRWATVQLFIKR